MEIVMTYDHMSSLMHAYGRPRNFGSCGSRQMILTVDWLISHQSPCLNDDGPEGRQVVCPGVSLISMSILDFSLFSEVNPSICYMKQLFFVRQQRIGRSRSRPFVWPGCFGCSDTHRKLGPEPQSEKTEDVLMSYPSICSA